MAVRSFPVRRGISCRRASPAPRRACAPAHRSTARLVADGLSHCSSQATATVIPTLGTKRKQFLAASAGVAGAEEGEEDEEEDEVEEGDVLGVTGCGSGRGASFTFTSLRPLLRTTPSVTSVFEALS